MSTILVLIYLSFISLGLPDSLLGSVWPALYPDIGAPMAAAGIISLMTTGGTVVSSLFSDRVIRRFGTAAVTLVSVAMTAAALLGNSFAPSAFWLCLFGIPLGLGAGSVDAALNGFVSLHYEARHMNWLHCFWGLGATAGPIIMSLYLLKQSGWRSGYFTIAIIQFLLAGVLLVALPLWQRMEQEKRPDEAAAGEITPIKNLIRIPGVSQTLLAFWLYCAAELTCGLWGSTFLVKARGVSAERAAQFIALYYLGITAGRIVSGFLSMRFSGAHLIRWGAVIAILGMLLLFAPVPLLSCMALILIGFGFAPIFPSLIHLTPARFGSQVSQSLIGFQMAMAYLGNTTMPPIFGLIAKNFGISWFPVFLAVLAVIMFICTEMVKRATEK